MSQVSNHKADHRHINEGFARLGQPFVVLAQTALTVQPGEGAFHHPASRQHHKAFLPWRLVHYLQLPSKHTLHPIYQLSSVAAISPYQRQSAEAPPVRVSGVRLLDALKQTLQQHLASISILHRGGSHYHQQYQTQRVHDQVSLAPSYILACIIATLLSTFYRFDTLAVQDCGTWLLVPTLLLSYRLTQSFVEPLPPAVDAPQPEVVVDALPGREVMRQRSPVAAVLGHVEDGIEYLSKAVLSWTTCAAG